MLIFLITAFLLIFFSLNLIFSKNTLYSILSLIVIFLFSSILLLQFGLDYIPLIFVSIYVGALSVLFLFVIMMLNSRVLVNNNNFFFYFFLIFFFFLFFLIVIFLEFVKFNCILDTNLTEPFVNLFIKENPLIVLGFILFTKNFIYVFLASIILFIAMMGSVSLVLEPYKELKSQIIFQQISRNFKNVFLKFL